MKNLKRIVSMLTTAAMLISMMTVFASGLTVSEVPDTTTQALNYDELFEEAYIINGAWTSADLAENQKVTFRFRNADITEDYDEARHFSSFDLAYSYYMSTDPDIMNDVPVFIFAPGTYSTLIEVRYSAIILGANAGINPNDTTEAWTSDAMSDGWAENSDRDSSNETVFSAGLTRTTRDSGNDAKWSYNLEQAENAAGEKSDIKFIVDGIKLTGGVGISQYDYSNHEYTNLTLNGSSFSYTPTGNRTTLTAFMNSVVESFTGTGANALFSARCNSYNKNDAVMKNVRITNLDISSTSSSQTLFNKFFRNVTIDGLYYAYSDTCIFGNTTTGATFCGNSSATTAVYDQKIVLKNSVFYKNTIGNPISIGNVSADSGFTKQESYITNNIFYDAIVGSTTTDYWGIFNLRSINTNAEYRMDVTHNIIHQTETPLQTLFNGNSGSQIAKTTINFNYNKVTGPIECIYPNTSAHSTSVVSNNLYYNFDYNFYASSPTDTGTLPGWTEPPSAVLASGYDFTLAEYYIDYDMEVLASDLYITSVSNLGDYISIDEANVVAECTGMTGTVTPVFTAKEGVTVKLYSEAAHMNEVTSIDLSAINGSKMYYIVCSKDGYKLTGTLTIKMDGYSDVPGLSSISPDKFNFPVINVNTENGAPIVDKENYVTCNISISNTDEEYCLTDTLAGIRYRGNSTFAADKKPYRIKFDKKQNLFGMGKAKSWVLLANAFDKTMVRNAIAFAIGQQLGLEFTSEFRFINLYLNGEYQGLYLLCEQTQTGETRVNVEESEDGKVDTGYLVEMAGNGDASEDRQFTINEIDSSLFGTGVTVNWRVNTIYGYVKTPELEFCTDEQLTHISTYVNSANASILTQDWETFNELCDVESFAKFFIVNTILNNGDGGYQIYTYKKQDGGKLYAGPIWDFDQSSAASTQCTEAYDKWYNGSTNPWFDSFSNWEEFLRLAKSIYNENIDEIESIINYYTNEFYPDNTYDFHANDVLWNSVESDYWRCTATVKTLKTYEANFNHLNEWFRNRTEWLSDQYDKITVLATGIKFNRDSLSIVKGTTGQLTVSFEPSDATVPEVVWTTSNPDVCDVLSNGVIEGFEDGDAVVTATIKDTDISASCNIHVYTVVELIGTISIEDTYCVGDVITPVIKIDGGEPSYTYKWFRDGKQIGAQTGKTYTVTSFDLGHTLTVSITGSGDTEGTLTSNGALIIKPRPDTPDAPTVESADDFSVTLVSISGHEYSIDDGESWQTSNVFTNLTPGNTYYFIQRVAETDSTSPSLASESLEYTLDKITPEKPAAPTVASNTTTSVTLSELYGHEYRMDSGEWQSSNIFTGLTPGSSHEFEQRTIETATTKASEISDKLSFTLPKESSSTPDAPAVDIQGDTSITLVFTVGYEYRVNGGEWQTSNTFDNLAPGSTYSFEQRIAETDTHYASEASDTLSITLPKLDAPTPENPEISSVGDTSITLTAIDGYEYRVNEGEWQSSNVFEGLTPGSTYSFEQRIAETATTNASIISDKTEHTLDKLTPQKPDAPTLVYSTHTSVTLTAIDGYEYRVNGGKWQSSNVFEGLTKGDTYEFEQRSAETATTKASEASDTFTISLIKPTVASPAAPVVDTKTETTVTLVHTEGYEYRINGGDWQSSNVFTDLTPGSTYFFEQRISETDENYASVASKSLSVTLSKLTAATPEDPAVLKYDDTTVTLVAIDGYEYRMDEGEWQASNVFKGLSPADTHSFEQRIAETDTVYASAVSEKLEVTLLKSTASTPVSPKAVTVTATSVTLVAVDGYEYRMDEGKWQASNIFEGLTPGSTHSFEQRIAETDTVYASAVSEKLEVTLLKQTVNTPKAPKILSVDATVVTLVKQDGYEYRINGGKWQSSNVFTGLKTSTEYTFSQRIAETATTYASAESDAVTAKTLTGLTSETFTDVKKGAFYEEAVDWAVANGITTGATATTFEPGSECTRAQAVTFLWRTAGSPEPTVTKTSFTDIKETGFYYKAVLWAVENGITTGTSATTFSPNDKCTRGQIVTFLWRAAGSPKVSIKSPFTDVKSTSFCYEAVLWAVENGITTGTTATTFAPNQDCTRGHIVTFLYRYKTAE